MLLKVIGPGCLAHLSPDTHTKIVVPLSGLCESRETDSGRPRRGKGPANMKSKRSPRRRACDLFMAFRVTLSDAGSCGAEHQHHMCRCFYGPSSITPDLHSTANAALEPKLCSVLLSSSQQHVWEGVNQHVADKIRRMFMPGHLLPSSNLYTHV